jgi:PmbA protein
VNWKDLPRPEKVGTEAVERTLALLGGRKEKTETLPIIIENRNVPRILGGLLQAMSGRAIQQKQSFLADKKGQKIGSDLLTFVDDPFVPRGLGSRLFDGDGITAKRRTMIDAGVLQEFSSTRTTAASEQEPTTGRSSNIISPPGKRSVEEIMKDLGRGILITDFIGGNSNSTTGDSSVGILGMLFEGGEPVRAVAEMNIAGNALEFWPKLIEVANDPWPHSSQRTPSLVFRDVVVSECEAAALRLLPHLPGQPPAVAGSVVSHSKSLQSPCPRMCQSQPMGRTSSANLPGGHRCERRRANRDNRVRYP